MTTKSKTKPPSVPEVIPKPKKGAPDPKSGVNKAIAWAKKNPALAALLIGGVILLAIVLMRKSTGISAARADSGDTGDGEDIMGGLGGLGLESYQEPLWSDFIFPEIPLLEEPSYTYWYPEEEELAQSSTFYPEDELDREHYLERAHELEALAGETEDPYFRGLIADMARLTGLGSLTEEDWETEERLRREWEERQNGGQVTTTQRSTAQPTITAVSPLQYLINKLKNVLTPRTVTSSTINQRQYTIHRAAQPEQDPITTSKVARNVSLIDQFRTPALVGKDRYRPAKGDLTRDFSSK